MDYFIVSGKVYRHILQINTTHKYNYMIILTMVYFFQNYTDIWSSFLLDGAPMVALEIMATCYVLTYRQDLQYCFNIQEIPKCIP